MEDALWETFAYVARYGKQPMSEIRRMSMADLNRLAIELSKIVKHENGPRQEG